MRTLSKYGLELLKQFEGCKLEAYRDSGGLLTIGFGHIRNVKSGDKITQAQAEDLLREDLARYTECVNKSVLVPINQNQFDALTSFSYNLGCGALKTSTLLRILNQLRYIEAADQFLRWNRVGSRVVQGLVNRREAERNLFLRGEPEIAKKVAKPKKK